jgi:hypothetical protein
MYAASSYICVRLSQALAAAEERAAAAAAALLEEEEKSTAAAKAASTKKKKKKKKEKGKRKGGAAASTQEQGPISALEASDATDESQVRLKCSTSVMSRSCRCYRRLGYGTFVRKHATLVSAAHDGRTHVCD